MLRMKDTEKQKMGIKHNESNGNIKSQELYSWQFLELVEKIPVLVCFCLYNLTRYSSIDP